MRSPLSFEGIYQPNRILVSSDENEEVDAESSFAHENRVSRSILRGLNQKPITVEEFLKRDQDALIFGLPGWGKTTFLHHIFRSTFKNDEILPVLISLRRPTAIDDLERYVDVCSRIQKTQNRGCTLLLVDGYGEVNHEQRKRVTEALLKFQAQRTGKFYLTCREYYQIPPLNAPEVRLDRFTRDDQMDGGDRERLLKHIAYRTSLPFVPQQKAEEITKRQLMRLGWEKVEPRAALLEIAQFYGILVPAEDGYEFVHRTIHEFLAANNG